jgi:tRNA A37 threonylcarbamoyladenosine dehydratase
MNQRHNRQSFLGPNSEAVLRTTTVAVIGLCGGGSHVAQQLAHIGVGKLVFIDPDHADTTNINRMVGRP